MNILISKMLENADPSQVEGLARFFKTRKGQYGEGDKFLGIKVPVTRAVVKECWRDVGLAELEECLASGYHEVRLAALLALVEMFRHDRQEKDREEFVGFYLAHTDRINNWDLVDLSCYPLLGEWLLDRDRSLLYDLLGVRQADGAAGMKKIVLDPKNSGVVKRLGGSVRTAGGDLAVQIDWTKKEMTVRVPNGIDVFFGGERLKYGQNELKV